MIRRPDKDQGTPAWVVTYGDMMSLLLCFFILLQAFSELKKDDRVQKMVESIQETFGYRGGFGHTPSDNPPEVSTMVRLKAQAAQTFQHLRSDTDVDGQDGSKTTVRTVRDGRPFTIGGTAAFEEGRAELRPQVHQELRGIAGQLRGLNNKIEIRGHTSAAHPLPDWPFPDPMDLSYHRAKAVAAFLVREGVNPLCIRLTGAGATEPLEERAYDPESWERNSRVEITVMESLIHDFQGEKIAAGASAQDGS